MSIATLAASRPLRPHELTFVFTYLENGRNATAAYLVAFPNSKRTTASVNAFRLLKRPVIEAAIAEADSRAQAAQQHAIQRYALDKEKLVHRLVTMAFTDIDQVAKAVPVLDQNGAEIGQSVALRRFEDVQPEARAAIESVVTDGRKVTIKLVDRRAAIMDIARLKGWVSDQPVDTKQLVTLKIER